MRARVRDHGAAVAMAAVAISLVAMLDLSQWAWTDYDVEARPAFDALVNGHITQFLQLAPAYGGSLVLRAPFVLIAHLWSAGELSMFRAAAVPCLFASAVFGVWLVARMRALGRSRGTQALALLLCVANPITLAALKYGHPEELLGAVLCVAAVFAAMRNRPIWAGVLLGLAVANKEWAVLAVGPVLLALPERRLRALLTAGAVGGLVLAPLIFAASGGSSGGFISSAKIAAAGTGTIFHPGQVWWFFGSYGHIAGGLQNIRPDFRSPPGWIESISHPLIVALMLPLTIACFWRRRHGRGATPHDAMLLLALLLLLRCVLDPWDNSYYPLPFLFALLAWEVSEFDRPPVLALTASFASWFVFQATGALNLNFSPDVQSLVFMSVALPATCAIAARLYAPGLRSYDRWLPIPSIARSPA
jgi:hypothetical protein